MPRLRAGVVKLLWRRRNAIARIFWSNCSLYFESECWQVKVPSTKHKVLNWSLIMNRLDSVEKTQLRNNISEFQHGDSVVVDGRIKESETKERLQAFEGFPIACTHGDVRDSTA